MNQLSATTAILAAASLLVVLTPSLSLCDQGAAPKYEFEQQLDWRSMKSSYVKSSKQGNMCSMIFSPDEMSNLDFDQVVGLYESALEHLATAASYANVIKKEVDPQVVGSFDNGGSDLVLKISDKRRELLEEKQKLLEKYANFGCSSVKGAIISEKTMYEAWIKVNKSKPETSAV